MRALLNQYSFVAIAVVALVVEWFALRRWRWVRRGALALTVVAAIAFAFTMRLATSDIDEVADLERALARGEPVALEFYSNY